MRIRLSVKGARETVDAVIAYVSVTWHVVGRETFKN